MEQTVSKIDDKSISVTTQLPTPEPVITVYVRADLEKRLSDSKLRQNRDNSLYSEEQVQIQALIDFCEKEGVLSTIN